MKRHALFVGVDQYNDGHIPNLSCAVSDATDLHGFFKYGAGYDQVELLPNPSSKKEVLGKVRSLTAGLGPGDFFLFFFAGHGFRVGDNHVLVCSNDLYDDVKYEDDGLPLGQLKRRLSGAFDSALLLDACQSDILATRGGEGIAERDLSLIHEVPAERPGYGALTVVTSCDAGQTAAELSERRHGLFTVAMLDLLKEAQRTHTRLDLSDAFRLSLGQRMGEIAGRSGLPTEQRPRFSCTGNSCFILLDGVVPTVSVPQPQPPPQLEHLAAPTLVVCPVCGKKNHPENTFKCRECGRDNLCLRHQDEATYLCAECADARRKARRRFVAVLKVREKVVCEEAERRQSNQVVCQDLNDKGDDYSFGRNGGAKDCAEGGGGQFNVSLTERIRAFCEEEKKAASWDELYVGGGVPFKKLANFRAVAASRGLDERGILFADPIALCDSTMFGSAKTGFLLTVKGIAVAGDWVSKTLVGYLSWEEFVDPTDTIRVENQSEILLSQNHGVFFNVSSCGRSGQDVVMFFRRLKEAMGVRPTVSSPALQLVEEAFADVRSDRLWIGGNIPLEKERNARQSMKVGEQPVFALYDNTFWGGSREGFAVAEKGFFFKNSNEEAGFVPWADVRDVNAVTGCIYVGRNKIECTNSMDLTAEQAVAAGLRFLAEWRDLFENTQPATAKQKARKVDGRTAGPHEEAREGTRNAESLSMSSCPAGECKTITLPGGAMMEMIYCPPGEFTMGSPNTEEGREIAERQHCVRLSKGFWFGKYPVTQQQWQSVMGNNPSDFKGDDLPVENVSWDDCKDFIDKVKSSAKQQLGGEARFPTEAEWEYACRAGTTTAYFWGNTLNGDKANCDGNCPCGTKTKGPCLKKTTPVGRYAPNPWGFYDMHGNVWEWCADWYGDYSGDAVDPTGPSAGGPRVLRGGGWNSLARRCRSAHRSGDNPGIRGDDCGFRLCCSAGPRG